MNAGWQRRAGSGQRRGRLRPGPGRAAERNARTVTLGADPPRSDHAECPDDAAAPTGRRGAPKSYGFALSWVGDNRPVVHNAGRARLPRTRPSKISPRSEVRTCCAYGAGAESFPCVHPANALGWECRPRTSRRGHGPDPRPGEFLCPEAGRSGSEYRVSQVRTWGPRPRAFPCSRLGGFGRGRASMAGLTCRGQGHRRRRVIIA